MNWNVLLVIVFHFMLKEVTIANGIYKTNEPVLITSKRHEGYSQAYKYTQTRTHKVANHPFTRHQ